MDDILINSASETVIKNVKIKENFVRISRLKKWVGLTSSSLLGRFCINQELYIRALLAKRMVHNISKVSHALATKEKNLKPLKNCTDEL